VDDLQSFWLEYQATRETGTRDRLTLQYSPLAKFVAGRVGGGAEVTSTVLRALVDAIEEFDGQGRFERFALQYMTGAVEDPTWDQTWEPDPGDIEVPVW
jgi:RNA polymerase sigma factor FliA